MKKLHLIYSLALSLFISTTAIATNKTSHINWIDWGDDIFTQASAQKRFIILDLEAVWCHWCHVMEQKTYSDPRVQNILQEHYLTVRVDQDARPDLANRYREYGWPATIIFAADGTEIVKRSGYIAPDNMLRLLNAIVADPSPEKAAALDLPKTFSRQSQLSEALSSTLHQRHLDAIDTLAGGLKTGHKYIDRDSLEYALLLAEQGDNTQTQWAKQTLKQALNLFDPVWGGVYQYSTQGDWQHKHYEKIMAIQAAYLRIYAQAYSLWKDPSYLHACTEIIRYLDTFMTSTHGAFYTSQDADIIQGQHSDAYFELGDKQRRAIGIPRIDQHVYARENGWMIEALATLYEVTGEQQYLKRAETAANWILTHRSLPSGGFSHEQTDQGGPYLGDNLSMGRALLQLYRATANRAWLTRATSSLHFINQHFRFEQAGYTPVKYYGQTLKPVPQIDENISLTRFANLMFHYTGEPSFKHIAAHSMRYLATESIAVSRLTEAGILIANIELRHDPLHITIIGGKHDKSANSFYQTGLRVTASYKRLEWWDVTEGKLPNPDVQYPLLGKTTAFVCSQGRCSLPLLSEQAIVKMLSANRKSLTNQ